MHNSWRFPTLVAAGGLVAAASVLVIPGPAPSASAVAFVSPGAVPPATVSPARTGSVGVPAHEPSPTRWPELVSRIRGLLQRAEAGR